MIAGVICSTSKFINELIDVNSGFAMIYGPVMDPRVAYELYSRLDHLHVRLLGHSKAAEILVKKLKDEGIKGVTYSGSPDHPNFSVIQRLFNTNFGYGGMVTIDCKTLENASRLAAKLQNEKFGLFAVSLGYSRTLMSCPSASTSSEIPLEDQEKIGLKRGLLRLSIGFSGDSDYLAEKFVKAYREVIKS
jgi:methionine-gamma-lyase